MKAVHKPKFPSIIDALIEAKRVQAMQAMREIGDSYIPTLRTDAACILEALVAELNEKEVLDVLQKQGLSAQAYRPTLRALAKIAKTRRIDRLAACQE